MTTSLASMTKAAVSIGALGLACVACDRGKAEPKGDRSGSEQSSQTTTTSAEPLTVGRIMAEPSSYYGKRVTLSGEVEAVTSGSREFTLDGNDWVDGNEIRVYARKPVVLAGAALLEHQRVRVTGTIRPFIAVEIERDLGWAPSTKLELARGPVFVADEIVAADTPRDGG